jgi:hypothetical protein
MKGHLLSVALITAIAVPLGAMYLDSRAPAQVQTVKYCEGTYDMWWQDAKCQRPAADLPKPFYGRQVNGGIEVDASQKPAMGFTPCPAEGCDFHYRSVQTKVVSNPDINPALLSPATFAERWDAMRDPVLYTDGPFMAAFDLDGTMLWSQVPIGYLPKEWKGIAGVLGAICPQETKELDEALCQTPAPTPSVLEKGEHGGLIISLPFFRIRLFVASPRYRYHARPAHRTVARNKPRREPTTQTVSREPPAVREPATSPPAPSSEGTKKVF